MKITELPSPYRELAEMRHEKKIFGIESKEICFRIERFAPIQEYGDSMSIAMELIQDMERVDKPVNPKVKEVQNA